MIELSTEDALRLNVLASQADAIRIDEGKMVVYGLQGDQEVKVTLKPTGRHDAYLRRVRELFSTIAIDSPGGYPVFLQRWTRMGQVDHGRLRQLLRLGEEEAAVAVACAPGLDDQLARLVWWAAHGSEVARKMLAREAVVEGEMGGVLARFLIEFLPFEESPFDLLESVRLVLQPGLIDEQQRERLWAAGRRKAAYRVGFLLADPAMLPAGVDARQESMNEMARVSSGQPADIDGLAEFRSWLSAPSARVWFTTAAEVIDQLAQPEVAVALMVAIGDRLAPVRSLLPAQLQQPRPLLEVLADSDSSVDTVALPGWQDDDRPTSRELLRALVALSQVGEHSLDVILAQTDAVGTVLRRRLAPLTGPLQSILQQMVGMTGVAADRSPGESS